MFMYVCMCMCVYVRTYVRMHAYVCVYTFTEDKLTSRRLITTCLKNLRPPLSPVRLPYCERRTDVKDTSLVVENGYRQMASNIFSQQYVGIVIQGYQVR